MSALESQIVASSVESGKAMGSAMKQDGKDEGLTELFKLNQVWYKLPPTLSLVSKRTITKCYFQQTRYDAPIYQQVASAIFNTGEFQVSGRTSFLVLQIGIDKSDPLLAPLFALPGDGGTSADAASISFNKQQVRALLGQGGILNLIDEVIFLSASGTEIDRQQNKGLLESHVRRNRMTQDWYNTAGELGGYPAGPYQYCYDRKGWPGYVESSTSTTALAVSPYVIPKRNSNNPDNSLRYLNNINRTATGGASNPNAKPETNYGTLTQTLPGTLPAVTNLQTSTYINPAYNNLGMPFGSGPVGSVDICYDSTQEDTWNPVAGECPTFMIPLSDLLGMFNPYMNALIPSQALAGGRIEIRFKNMTEALIATGPAFAGSGAPYSSVAAAYTSSPSIANANTFLNRCAIKNAYFLLDSFQMNEGTLRRLNEAAAGNEGLSVMFDTWDWTQTPVSGTSFEAQVAQARSRILRSFCVIRDQLVRSHPFANSLASEAAINRATVNNPRILTPATTEDDEGPLINTYQAQLGSLYFPQQPLQTFEELVMNAYYVFGKVFQDQNEINAVSYQDFLGANGDNLYSSGVPVAPISRSQVDTTATVTDQQRAYGYNLWPGWMINWGSATYGFLAERSQLLQLSGLPISNARLLRHRFVVNYAEQSGTGRIVDVFTEYTRVMKVFLGGRIVMRE